MSLLQSMRERARAARASGALEPIPTRVETLRDGGVRFVVRLSDIAALKERAAEKERDEGRDPFLPYDAELFVRDLSPTHVALLNKFNVLDDHLLVVTRAFEEQESFLTVEDFDAFGRVMKELDALFFYNAGPRAGASQRHKHLQFVPRESFPTPLEEIYRDGVELGFVFARVSLAANDPAALRATYVELLEAIGRDAHPTAYNLLATRELLVAVPRSRESAEGISVNGLGFAGSLFVRTAADLGRLRELGPLAVLRAVGHGR